MPFYNFVCDRCGKRFEDLVPYERRDEVRCKECGGETRVLVSAFAVKGSSTSSGGSVAAAPARGGFS